MNNMLKKISFIALVVFALSSFSFIGIGNNYPTKITICHIPPGNPSNCHEITVSLNALQAHLDHGDALVCHDLQEIDAYTALAYANNVPLIVNR